MDDDSVVRARYASEGAYPLVSVLHASVHSIWHRAKMLGIHRDHRAQGKQVMGNMDTRRRAITNMHKTNAERGVWNKGKKFSVEEQRSRNHSGQHVWTEEDDEIIREMYPTEMAGLNARIIGVSAQSVTSRAKVLGVRADFSLRAKERDARPGYRERWLASQRTPEARESRRQTMKRIMSDPAERARFLENGRASRFDSDSELHQRALDASVAAWTPERRLRASVSHQATWRDDDFRERWCESRAKRDRINPVHPHAKFRPDVGHYCRSSWEANYARILRLLGFTYEYEPVRWYFKDGKRKMYRPDFYVNEADQYIEIKGFNPAFGDDGMERFRLYRQQNPGIGIVLVDPAHYRQLQLRYADQIPMWETERRNINTHPHLFNGAQQSMQLAVRGLA